MSPEDVDAQEPFSHGGRYVLPWFKCKVCSFSSMLRCVHLGYAPCDDEMI